LVVCLTGALTGLPVSDVKIARCIRSTHSCEDYSVNAIAVTSYVMKLKLFLDLKTYQQISCCQVS